MHTKVQQRTEFIDSLEHEIARFKVMCDISVCSGQFPKALHGIQVQGRYLARGIQDIVNLAADLETRLGSDPEDLPGPTVAKGYAEGRMDGNNA